MNKKLVKTMLIILIAITIIGVSAAIVIINLSKDTQANAKRTIDDIITSSYETPEITTDLKGDQIVQIQFQIVTDSKDAKEELSKREFQIKNVIIKELSKMTQQDFETGLTNVENLLKIHLNEILDTGKITDVYTIKKVMS